METAQRLERALATYCLVAWRLLWLTYQERETPEACCELALETHEWQALYAFLHHTSTVPVTPPSLREAIHWIAQAFRLSRSQERWGAWTANTLAWITPFR